MEKETRVISQIETAMISTWCKQGGAWTLQAGMKEVA